MNTKSRLDNHRLLTLLTFLAFLLRTNNLTTQPLTGDESFTIQFSARPLEVVFPEIATVEPNPPLYYSLFHYWMRATGDSEFATRFFSLFFGVVCVSLIWKLGREMSGEKLGLVAALLMAINPFQIWHSQDVRLYTLWPAIAIFSLIFFLLLPREAKPQFWIGYFVFTLAGLYTHYFHFFILLAINLLFFGLLVDESIAHRPIGLRRLLPKWLGMHLILILLYVPWMLVTNRPTSYFPSGETPEIWQLLPRLLSTFTVGETVPSGMVWGLGIILIPFSLVAVWLLAKEKPRDALFLLLYILVPAFAVYILAQWRPFFRERYLNAISPGFYLLFAYGLVLIEKWWPKRGRIAMAGGLLAFTLASAYSLNNYWYGPDYAKSPNWPRLAAFLEERVKPDEIIIFNYPDPSLDYYYDGPAPLLIVPSGFITPERRRETVEILLGLVNRYQKIWFLPLTSRAWDPDGLVEKWLNLHGDVIRQRNIAGFRLLLYRPLLASEEDIEQRLDFRLGDSLRMVGYNLSQPTNMHGGETISFNLYWQAFKSIAEDYHVFTHLIDNTGNIWAQKDNAPRGGDYPTYLWAQGELVRDKYQLIIDPNAPPGEYRLVVGMYLLESGERLTVFNTEGERVGDEIEIARVEVE